MKTFARIAVLIGLVLLVTVVVLRRTPVQESRPAAAASTRTPRARLPTNALPATSAATNHVDVPPEILNEFNRFVALVKPFGIDEPIEAQEVLHLEPSRPGPKARMVLATKSHVAQIDRHNLLRYFLATFDSSNPPVEAKAKKEATSKWYQASAKWSGEEALAETYRVMDRLGIQFKAGRYEVDAPKMTLRTPEGESVEVTPFYVVKLYNENNTMVINAEFRVGESGPGRLTMWWENLPLEAHQRAGSAR